jgi:hypothetical protein
MNKEQTLKAIEVMQAYVDGKKIQVTPPRNQLLIGIAAEQWIDIDNPSWEWRLVDYRVKPVSKPSIIWDHVHPDYKYLFTESNGSSYLVASEPTLSSAYWLIDAEDEYYVKAEGFASFIPGDCDWKESLVQRPESV